MSNLAKTMDTIADLHKSHGVKQKGGKLYTQVVHRMEAFRREHGTLFGIDTQILVDDGKKVVVKAIITDKDNRIIGSGMAEEIRGQGHFQLGDKRNINTLQSIDCNNIIKNLSIKYKNIKHLELSALKGSNFEILKDIFIDTIFDNYNDLLVDSDNNIRNNYYCSGNRDKDIDDIDDLDQKNCCNIN